MDGPDQPPFEFLYDLINDPDQLNNIASNDKSLATLIKMRARCDELIAETGPAMKDVGTNPPTPRKKKSP